MQKLFAKVVCIAICSAVNISAVSPVYVVSMSDFKPVSESMLGK